LREQKVLARDNVLATMQAFAAAIEERSFSAAARRLGLTASSVSKQVAKLEERLGVRLFQRTTRVLRPTDAGISYYERCARILHDIESADRQLQSHGAEPRGTLRVSAPLTLGHACVVPTVIAYRARYPEVQLHVELTDRVVDIVEERIDVAIRFARALPSSSLVAKRVAPDRRHLCAAPAYLRARGRPKRPDDLSHHECLLFVAERLRSDWHLTGPSGSHHVPVRGPFSFTSTMAIHQAALAGAGIADLPRYLVHDALREGRLVSVLDDYSSSDRVIYAMHPHGRWASAAVRTFIGEVTARIRADTGGA